MTESILGSTKKVLGILPDYTAFDIDIIMHINSALSVLHQLGVGPEAGFMIEDDSATWGQFLGIDPAFNLVKTYVYLKVRLIFDPPPTSFAIAAAERQIAEHEFRINVVREGVKYPWQTPLTTSSTES